MTARLAENLKFSANDINGDPWVGAKLYSYETGTTNPKTTWVDSTKSAPNANPIVLDSYGQATVFIDSTDGAYRFRLVSPGGVTIWTVDNVKSPIELLDEDAMTSNSASAAPSQQSTKAYVDDLRADMGNLIDQDLRQAAAPHFAGLYISGNIVKSGACVEADQHLKTTDSPAFAGLSVGGSPVLTEESYTPEINFLQSNVTVTVGSGGNHNSINGALLWLTENYYPVYRSGGVRATINLLTGFTMAEQVLVDGIDLGWITIVGADAETTINRSYLTAAINGRTPAFGVTNGGILPVIDQLFTMNTSGSESLKDGFVAYGSGSSINILSGAGCKNSGNYGIAAFNGAVVNAPGAILSGSGTMGIYSINGSVINAPDVDVSGSGSYGVCASNGSVVNIDGGDASGSGNIGIFADGASRINASDADASGAANYGVYSAKGSVVNITGGDAKKGVIASSSDLIVGNGGIIIGAGGPPGMASAGGASITVNTLSVAGIIWS